MADDTKLVHRPRFIDIVKKGASDFSQKKNYLPVNQILPTARGSDGRIVDVSGSWWSPLQPITPAAPVDQRPRQRAVVPGENIVWTPGADKLLGYETLRALADTWDVLRLIIETRKDQLCSLDWEIRVKEKPGEKNSDRKQRQLEDPNVQKIKSFLEKPDGFNPWQRWLRMWLEDSLVLDAVSLWYERDKSGKIANVIPLDAATISRCMTDQGLTPPPPSVAYQQVLYGVPAFDLTTDDLLYSMRNPRTNRRYGYSRIEQMMATIGTGIRSQDFLLKYYTDGNMPEAMVFLPSDLGIDRVKEVQNWFDAVMAGDLARRRRLTFLPGYGSGDNVKPNVVFPKEALLKAPTDEWIVLIACFCFGVSPQPFIKMMNRATAEVARESAEAEGLKPDADYIKEVVNQIIDDLGYSEDYEFAWQDRRDVDPKTAAETDNILVGKIYTINEIREKRGDDPFDADEADMLGVFGPTGFVPLSVDDAAERQQILNPAAPEDGSEPTPPAKKKPAKKPPTDAIANKKVNGRANGLVNQIGFAAGGVLEVAPVLTGHYHKYSDDQPRDEHGRWVSGAGKSIHPKTRVEAQKAISKAMKSWVNYSADIDKQSAEIIKSGKDINPLKSNAEAIIYGVRHEGEIFNQSLYRGLQIGKEESVFDNLKEGDKLEVPSAKSFTTKQGQAEHFAGPEAGYGWKEGESRPVIIEVKSGAQGLSVSKFSSRSFDQNSPEVITNGAFRVVSVTKTGPGEIDTRRGTPYGSVYKTGGSIHIVVEHLGVH